MKLFSKVAFICNLSFLVMAILRYIEIRSKNNHSSEAVIPLPFLTGLLVILGQLAIFINLVYCLSLLVIWIVKKKLPAPVWIALINISFFILQVFYFLLT